MESLTHSEIFWWCLRFFVHSLAKVYMCSLFEVSSVVSHNVIKERRMSHTLWESHGITSCHCAKLNWIITAGNINGILSLQPAATSVFWPSPKTQIQSLVGPARVRMPESWTWRVEMFLCWSCGRIGALNSLTVWMMMFGLSQQLDWKEVRGHLFPEEVSSRRNLTEGHRETLTTSCCRWVTQCVLERERDLCQSDLWPCVTVRATSECLCPDSLCKHGSMWGGISIVSTSVCVCVCVCSLEFILDTRRLFQFVW